MTQLDPKFGPWGPDPTHLGLNLDGSPAQPDLKSDSNRVHLGLSLLSTLYGSTMI